MSNGIDGLKLSDRVKSIVGDRELVKVSEAEGKHPCYGCELRYMCDDCENLGCFAGSYIFKFKDELEWGSEQPKQDSQLKFKVGDSAYVILLTEIVKSEVISITLNRKVTHYTVKGEDWEGDVEEHHLFKSKNEAIQGFMNANNIEIKHTIGGLI